MLKGIALLKISLLILLITSFSFPKDSNYEKVKVVEVGPGFIYYEFVDTTGPIHIYMLEMDLTIPTNKIKVRIANDLLNKGGERTSDLVKRMIKKGEFVIGAVNTDFYGGKPRQAENSMIIDGEYAKGVNLDRGMFAITDSNVPFIGDFQFDGFILLDSDTVQINSINSLNTKGVNLYNYNFSGTDFIDSTNNYLKVNPKKLIEINSLNEFVIEKIVTDGSKLNIQYGDYWISLNDSIFNNYNLKAGENLNIYLGTTTIIDDIYTLVGGLPTLVTEGKRPESFIGIERLTSKGFIGKNPRTVIGYNKAKTKLFVAAIDGRQKSHSVGMSLYELADFMISIGCYDLLNLDGGGSTTITLR
ncbi:MAG: phosphodiester glycosidase family protein, partial [Melioribacteraceae bacterium]|nr:phosphodiester glycosidase family protein [Melioribacteraceae bacterium]